MRFLVEMGMKVQPTPEIMALLPDETARGLELDSQGIREHLFLAADNSRAWQVFRAESLDEMKAIVESFPMAPYSAVTITALAE